MEDLYSLSKPLLLTRLAEGRAQIADMTGLTEEDDNLVLQVYVQEVALEALQGPGYAPISRMPARQREYLEALEKHDGRMTKACLETGVSTLTPYNWRKKSPEFAQQYEAIVRRTIMSRALSAGRLPNLETE